MLRVLVVVVVVVSCILRLSNGGGSWQQTAARFRPFSVVDPSSINNYHRHATRRRRRAWGVLVDLRGGAETTTTTADDATSAPPTRSLDERVKAAMAKFGLSAPESANEQNDGEGPKKEDDDSENCQDGVCAMPTATQQLAGEEVKESAQEEIPEETNVEAAATTEETMHDVVSRLSDEFEVDKSIVWAAVGATNMDGSDSPPKIDEEAVRQILQVELDAVRSIPDDSPGLQTLKEEGFADEFLIRRALAFADNDIDNARAILVADQEDEAEEAAAAAAVAKANESAASEPKEEESPIVDNTIPEFTPPPLPTVQSPPPESTTPPPPKPAAKEDVIFDATTAELQKLLLESPVPVLVDVYADWCGPCKALTPVLEEITIKGGGMFRLVKINADNERAVTSGALGVSALPTVFAVNKGKILHKFQGMPSGEEAMRNFLMGLLVPPHQFTPPVTPEEERQYQELSTKLAKVVGASSLSFAARERLQHRTATLLDEVTAQAHGDMATSEASAMVLRTLLSNIIHHPHELKYRKVNMENAKIASTIGPYPAALSILSSVGFAWENPTVKTTLLLAVDKAVVNVAPLVVVRDAVDKWIDRHRYEIAKATRKRKEEADRQRLAEEAAARGDEEDDDDEEEEEEQVDPNICNLKVRLEGRKRIQEIAVHGDEPLSAVLDALQMEDSGNVQIACTSKKLLVQSSDEDAMNISLRDYGLLPSSSLVIRRGVAANANPGSSSSLADRAAARRKRKRGSHTMQSVGIYAKDDNAKGELIDGGGGVWYEHDVDEDEEEQAKETEEEDEDEKDESHDEGEENDEDGEDDATEQDEDEGEENDDYDDPMARRKRRRKRNGDEDPDDDDEEEEV